MALGYDRKILPRQYRWRYDRGGIAARLVEAKPFATWRGGGELVEDEDPDTETAFEKAWDDLNTRLSVWTMFEQVDILAGLGHYAVLLLGGPGDLAVPLERLGPTGLLYLQPYSERDVQVESFQAESANPRFGQPEFYNINRLYATTLSYPASNEARRVHYTRALHVADNSLDVQGFGASRLERVWNYLDDLDKVVGGGAEAFWKRVDAGMQLKLDPKVGDMTPEAKKAFDEQLEDYTNGLRRILRTRGVDIEMLTSQVADIKGPIDAIISLISAATSIPQRILMGSERGELASSQDRDEWSERIHDRRVSFAGPKIVRPFVDMMIAYGVLPVPKQYEVRWPAMKSMDEIQKMALAKDAAQINQYMGKDVVLEQEIRDRYLDLPPLEDVLTPEELAARNAPPPTPVFGSPVPPKKMPIAAERRARKWAVLTTAERARYIARVTKRKEPSKTIHTVADSFFRRNERDRARRLQTGTEGH